jgi:hypothetical protein
MVWQILLAHFLADYPLQPDWMVRAKRQPWGLGLHVGIHLIVMLVLFLPSLPLVWPYLLALAGIHLLIDLGKNKINTLRPDWVVGPYAVDQFLHFVSIWLMAGRMEQTVGQVAFLFPANWSIYITAYLIVTYVWYISERILTHAETNYRQEVIALFIPRLLVRALLFSVLVLGRNLLFPAPLVLAVALQCPHLYGKYCRRAILTDVAVVFGVLLFMQIALPLSG